MTQPTHGERVPIPEVLSLLHGGFGDNLATVSRKFEENLDRIDLQSRMISEARNVLGKNFCHGPVQVTICNELLDEIFSDFSLAMYFCAVGLIVPSQMSTRRAFELGTAAVYLWDLPHSFWGWRNKDEDLSFSAMVAHFNSPGYLEYVKQLRKSDDPLVICKQAEFQNIYRELSNTVHGKVSALPPLSPARFSASSAEDFVGKQFALIERAQSAILKLLYGRFSGLKEAIEASMPMVKRK